MRIDLGLAAIVVICLGVFFVVGMGELDQYAQTSGIATGNYSTVYHVWTVMNQLVGVTWPAIAVLILIIAFVALFKGI